MDYKSENNLASSIGYLTIGAGIGAVLGLLFAPKAGKEIREDVNEWLRDKRLMGRRQTRVIQEAIEKGRRSVMHKVHRVNRH